MNRHKQVVKTNSGTWVTDLKTAKGAIVKLIRRRDSDGATAVCFADGSWLEFKSAGDGTSQHMQFFPGPKKRVKKVSISAKNMPFDSLEMFAKIDRLQAAVQIVADNMNWPDSDAGETAQSVATFLLK